MTTARQIKKLVAPLLARHPDLALVDRRFLAVRPVTHVLRGILIDRTSSAKHFNVRWSVCHLFTLRYGISAYAGSNVYPTDTPLWDIIAPDIAETLCAHVEGPVLDRLRSVSTIDDYVALATGPGIFMPPIAWPELRMAAEIAMGNLDAARTICEGRTRFLENEHTIPGVAEVAELGRTLRPLVMSGDRAGLAALLHAWEAESVANLRIGHIWERTPFPLENEV